MASTNGSINQSKDKMTPAAARAASKKSMASKPKKTCFPAFNKKGDTPDFGCQQWLWRFCRAPDFQGQGGIRQCL